MNNEAEDDNDTLSDLQTNALRKVRTSNAYPVTAAMANDLDGSVPLSKIKTSVSVVSRKSFQHNVVCGNRKRVLYAANVGDSRIVLCRPEAVHSASRTTIKAQTRQSKSVLFVLAEWW